ncbi:ABC transporter [Nitratireductor indicus C115]|uniref:ABC transporter n=1 Tax=Nitratireductor indicus C115 TaxID=1231190 RepID=K2NQB5_9HYPH|nr:ABC transporter [Nitratireductor indicus C115]
MTNVYLQVEGAEDTVVIKIGGVQNFDKGQTVRVSAAPDKLHLFNSEGRSLLYI